MAKVITPVQPLILTEAGVKPTIPTPSTIMPTDPRFNNQSDLMVGQLAYNVIDDVWYYRSSTLIKPLSGGEVTVNDVEVWRSDKLYSAGNTYVSYVNPQSSNAQFQTSSIYRCITSTLRRESPETSPSKWELQGASVDLTTVSAIDVLYDNTDSGLSADNVKAALDELANQKAGASSTGENLGTGNGIYKQNSGTVLQFRSISGTGNVSVSTNGDNIEINSDGEANTYSDLGTEGESIIGTKSGVDLPFKRIEGGTDISIDSSDPNKLTLNANVPLKSATNVGVGVGIFDSIISNAARLRSLLAGTNISISLTIDDEIQISCTAESNTASNVGTGSGLFLQKVSEDLQFKSLVAGSNISISSQANTLTISSPAEVHGISNVGGANNLFKQISSNLAQFKTIAAGTGISIDASGDAIVISSSGGLPSGSQGDILYHNGSDWAVLSAGAPGYVLSTNGPSLNPSWIEGGGGAAERENTSVTISSNAQTTTVDFSAVDVKTLTINDTITTHIIAVSNLSTTERYNTIVIDNTDNTVGVTVTLDDQTGAITFRNAKNDFPGIYPNMNVAAGAIWEINFENRSATVVTVGFDELENN